MTWVRLDDEFPEHLKLARLGDWAPLAGWLFVCGLAYCNRQMTDGEIPKGILPRLASFRHIGIETAGVEGIVGFGEDVENEALALMLVKVNMWEDGGDHWRVHDYLDYQPSKAQVESERAAKVAAGQAGGIAAAKARAQANGHAPALAKSKPKPVPKPNPVPVPNDPNQFSSGVVTFFLLHEEKIGSLAQSSGQRIGDWEGRLPSGDDGRITVEYAFAEAEREGKLNLAYVEGILKRLEGEGWPIDD